VKLDSEFLLMIIFYYESLTESASVRTKPTNDMRWDDLSSEEARQAIDDPAGPVKPGVWDPTPVTVLW